MALALTLDYPLSTIVEPGYFKSFPAQALSFGAQSGDLASQRGFWADKEGHVLMLRPLQLEENWLNSAAQVPYIIRKAAFQTQATNESNLLIFEANYLQNPNNPWIFHSPISPTAAVTFVDSPEQLNLQEIDGHSEQEHSVVGFPTAFAPGEELPPPGFGASDAKVICWSKENLPGNQPLLLRWHVAAGSVGHKTLYGFRIGQFVVEVGPTTVEILEDTSAAQDGSGRVSRMRAPLFTGGPVQTTGFFSDLINGIVTEYQGHDRSLLWLPYRRNRVYLESSYGQHAVLTAETFPRSNGLTGTDLDWDIVKPAKLLVYGLTPGAGWFQIQKLAFQSTATLRAKPFVIDYAPATALAAGNFHFDSDTPHGATITASAITTPPAYNYTVNTLEGDCQVLSTLPEASQQNRTYGFSLTMTAGTDAGLNTFSPQLYLLEIRVPRVTGTWPLTAVTVGAVSAANTARIQKATLAASLGSGDYLEGEGNARLSVEMMDFAATLAAKYERSFYPIQLKDGATVLFTGYSEPNEVDPLRLDAAAPRVLHFNAVDPWKLMANALMRDQRDWTGFGHITAVYSVVQQAGIDITGADGPASGSAYDTPLGGLNATSVQDIGATDGIVSNATLAFKPTWAPVVEPPDTHADYVKRIAKLFANWQIGFHADGTFFYMPRDYYTTSEVVFFKSRATNPAGPCYESPIEFRTVELEANVIQAQAGHVNAGARLASTVWVDWASIKNQAAVNFIGRGKAEIIGFQGVLTCAEINRIAFVIFQQTRRRRRKVRFRGDYVPSLRVGHCFQLEGEGGLTYRLSSFRANYERTGWTPTEYEAEVVEAGF